MMWRWLRLRFQRVGLQRRIMLYVTAGLVVFSAIYGWVALQATQQSSNLVFHERLLAAGALARVMDNSLGHLQGELQDAGDQLAPDLGPTRPNLSAAQDVLRHLYTHWVAYHDFANPSSISLTDAHGTILWSQPDGHLVGQPANPFAAWQATFRSQRPVIMEDPATDGTGGAMIALAVPIQANGAARSDTPVSFTGIPPIPNSEERASGQTLGYLIGEIDRAHVGAMLESDLRVADPGYAVELIDASGLVIASSDKAQDLLESQHRALVAGLLQARQAGVRTHTFEVNGTPTSHVVAFAPLPLMPWGVIVEQEEDQALLLPHRLQIEFVGFGLLALLAGLALAWLTTRTVVRPVNALINASQEIASGNLDRALDITGTDEVGALSRSFDEMRVELKESREEIAGWNRELEARVGRRTRELRALVESSHALTSTLELDALFEILMKKTNEILPAAEGIALFLLESETQMLVVRSTFGLDASLCTNLRFAQGEALGGKVFQSQAPALLRTAEEVSASQANFSAENRAHFKQAIGDREARSALGVALVSKGARLGALVLYNFSTEAAFAESDVPVLQALADQAAAAIENGRLYREAGEAGALRELNRLKSEFVARASHELRTPLTAIKSLAETLLRPDLELDAKTRREFLEGIDNASDRLNEIVKQLLMLSRVEAGRLEIKRETVNLGAVVARVGSRFRAQAPNRVIEVLTPRELPHAQGDADRIEDALTNLISNALKYSSAETPVVVRTQASDGRLVVSVQDMGIGIPPEARERIFERFYRVDNNVTRRVGGAGLGLHLSKTYVEGMGGTIQVESEEGRGSVFSFTLPQAKDPLTQCPD